MRQDKEGPEKRAGFCCHTKNTLLVADLRSSGLNIAESSQTLGCEMRIELSDTDYDQ